MIVSALFKSRVAISYSSKLHWFSNQLRGLLFLVSDSRVEVSNMGLNTLLPREDTQACDIPSSFVSPPRDVSPNQTVSLFLPNCI